MKELIVTLIEFIRSSFPVSYGEEKIEVDGKPFFMILDEGHKLTLKSYIGTHYPDGKKLIINRRGQYIFSDYNKAGLMDRNLWLSYFYSEDKKNFAFTMINETNEIVRRMAS